MKLAREEIGRKILHIFSGTLIPGGIFYIPLWVPRFDWLPTPPDPRIYPALILGVLTVIFVGIDLIRLHVPAISKMFLASFGSMLRKEESHKLTGATYIFASGFICSLLFMNQRHIAAIVLSTFIWGDAVAALVGQSIGKIKIGKKSLEGSLACFILCLVMYYGLFPLAPELLESWGGLPPISLALLGSFAVTIMELFPVKVGSTFELNDNLTVPVVTGILLVGVQRFVV